MSAGSTESQDLEDLADLEGLVDLEDPVDLEDRAAMAVKPSITVYCVPHCGHARAVLELLRRRGLPFTKHVLTPVVASEVIEAYHLYGSPVLVIDGEVTTGYARIMARIETLAASA